MRGGQWEGGTRSERGREETGCGEGEGLASGA